MDLLLSPLGIIAAVVVVALIVAFAIYRTIKGWIRTAKSDEALVISGRKDAETAGESSVSVVLQGRAIVNPILQTVEVMSLRQRQVNLSVRAQSENGIPLQVEAVALVKVGGTKLLVTKASERFISQDEAIVAFTTEQLEGALRGVVATLDVKTLMNDRKKFGEQIASGISGELAEQGLVLDSFQIKNIDDPKDVEFKYVQALSAQEAESKRLEAETARANTNRAIEKRTIEVSEETLVERTKLQQNEIAAQQETGSARARAESAESLAREHSQNEVIGQRAENRKRELEAEVSAPADAELYRRQREADAVRYEAETAAQTRASVAQLDAEAAKVAAVARAESVRLEGEARAAALAAESEARAQHADILLASELVQQLPQIMREFSANAANVGSVTIVGGGENGTSDHLGREQAGAMAGMMKVVEQTTGINLAELITGRAVGQGIANGLKQDGDEGSSLLGQMKS